MPQTTQTSSPMGGQVSESFEIFLVLFRLEKTQTLAGEDAG